METDHQIIRTRFAPSPTGFVHIGSLRTALFSYLFARHMGGQHVLRIEDTDQNRLVEGAVENLIEVLSSLGIEFDEGFKLDGERLVEQYGNFGPYLQSERLPIYHKYVNQLLESGAAYYCFCSESRLDELRRDQTALKQPPMYDKLCRKLTKEEVEAKLKEFEASHLRPVVRQAIPIGGSTVIHDLIHKDILVEHKVLDDQVLLKSDGFPTYHLAVVIDDHLMEITHVIRGEEWIASTPKHILLYKAFGWTPTKFAHLPLILNPDKSKLSKRQGDVAVESYLKKGYLKEALVNFVAFLGWNPKTEQEVFTMDELIKNFDLSKVNKAGAVFDISKLDWMNGLYIRKIESEKLVEVLKPYWQEAELFKTGEFTDEYLISITSMEKDRLKKLSDIVDRTRYFFAEPAVDPEMVVWKNSDRSTTKERLGKLVEFLSSLDMESLKSTELESEIKGFIQANNYDNGSVLWPLRVSLSGLAASPGPFEILPAMVKGLGKSVVLERLNRVLAKL